MVKEESKKSKNSHENNISKQNTDLENVMEGSMVVDLEKNGDKKRKISNKRRQARSKSR